MQKHRLFSLRTAAGSALIVLGAALLAWAVAPRFLPSNVTDNPRAVHYDNVPITEFAESFLYATLNYSVQLSDDARSLQKQGSFAAVKDHPISRTLLLASHTWGVKFYLHNDNAFVCLPDEQPPDAFNSAQTEMIYAEPLPIVHNLQFSYARHMCGPNCLALLSYALARPISVDEVAKLAKTDPTNGTTMSGLLAAARSLGLDAKGVEMSLDLYKKLKSPVLIHLDAAGGHYAVLHGYNDDGTFSLIDPPVTRLISEADLKRQYTGRALFVWRK